MVPKNQELRLSWHLIFIKLKVYQHNRQLFLTKSLHFLMKLGNYQVIRLHLNKSSKSFTMDFISILRVEYSKLDIIEAMRILIIIGGQDILVKSLEGLTLNYLLSIVSLGNYFEELKGYCLDKLGSESIEFLYKGYSYFIVDIRINKNLIIIFVVYILIL